MSKIKLGFAMCGSFCTISRATEQMSALADMGYDILPIVSFNVLNLSTRFGDARERIKNIEKISGKKVISTLVEAEPIGPENLTDIMVVAPCTGSTLSKISCALADTPVALAAKAHLRSGKPLVICLASNDALGASLFNISKAMNTKNIYFVPMSQDDCVKKPTSLVAHFNLIPQTIEKALQGKQIQPVIG